MTVTNKRHSMHIVLQKLVDIVNINLNSLELNQVKFIPFHSKNLLCEAYEPFHSKQIKPIEIKQFLFKNLKIILFVSITYLLINNLNSIIIYVKSSVIWFFSYITLLINKSKCSICKRLPFKTIRLSKFKSCWYLLPSFAIQLPEASTN